MTKSVIMYSRYVVKRETMVVNVAKMQDAKAGTVSQVTAESVRQLAVAQVVIHRLIFASLVPCNCLKGHMVRMANL